MHTVDKAIRVVFSIAVALLYVTNIISGVTAIVLGVVAIILMATVFINFCPIYHFLGISTKKKIIHSTEK